jgi:hypothetical protein
MRMINFCFWCSYKGRKEQFFREIQELASNEGKTMVSNLT